MCSNTLTKIILVDPYTIGFGGHERFRDQAIAEEGEPY